ncbi:MAG TPA: adenylate/guanylate cyclase domain-containing protein [Spirochaetia bacterium]|nr:adenylate/guanylate cyclase domain-containing protein [Spirochaetia bacterium]
MSTIVDKVLGHKIKGVRVVPLVLKIVTIFTVLLLVSNFISNYVNLMLNRGELLKLMNQLLVKDLKELSIFSMNQYQIYQFNNDFNGAITSIKDSADKTLTRQKSIALGVKPDGKVVFDASKTVHITDLTDSSALAELNKAKDSTTPEGSILFYINGSRFFGVYKWNDKWGMFLIRAEELNEFYSDSWAIFRQIAYIIVGLTLLCVVLGVFLIRFMLRYVQVITKGIMDMQENQNMSIIDLKGAPNDDITYLGVALNSTTSTVDNLMNIFRKFVTADLAQKAYREKEIKLEGSQRDLTVLFTDIRSFTYMTETLGSDIIKLLNLHYDKAIHHIQLNGGIVGSIIGDALLAVFGALENWGKNKSYEAVRSAYQVHEVAAALREEMTARREEIVKRQGALSAIDEKVYRAVLLDVGVGIDGGDVFYGTIGSNERMTNTVIGDNVNSSSRLEGLTRFYKVPVIVSAYVKDEVERDYDDYHFMEIDQVQVKGKTEGKRIFWPLLKKSIDEDLEKNTTLFAEGLKSYYEGQWPAAYKQFARCALPLAEIFRDRTRNNTSPKGWDGIWAMTTK